MKTLSLLLVSFFLFFKAHAQISKSLINIRGSVIDSASGKLLSYVTVALQDAKTQSTSKSTLTKEDGSFQLSASGDKTWVLLFASAGYNNKSVPLEGNSPEVNLGKILLSSSSKQLKEVTITALRPVIKRQIDGITYDVTADPEAPAISALDMMRKVPLISLDANDNIQLKGSGNYKILINGKESALVAKNPSDFLRAMPASNIEKIEVITTPPAKYDAEGLAGIINIITKKNVDQGYNVNINARYNTLWGPGLNVNGTFKKGKFGLSGYAGMGANPPHTTTSVNTQTFFPSNTVLTQNGTNTFQEHWYYGDVESSYEFDSLDLLTGSFQLFQGTNNQSGTQFTTQMDSAHTLQQQYLLSNVGNSGWGGLDASLNYQRGFRSDKNRLLTLSYKYSYSPNHQTTSNVLSDTLNYPVPNYQQYNKSGNRESTIQLDYVHPIKKWAIEAGGKAILRNNFSDFQTNNYDNLMGDYEIDTAQTDNFKYLQNIYSLYNSDQFKWNDDKWTAKVGLRVEYTTVNADFTSVQYPVKEDYTNWIPSISLQRNIGNNSFNFGYTNRISRPSIYQLNPFVNKSNPQFISTGNPNLQPEVDHNFELNYSNFSKASINVGLSYSYSKNSIQNVSSLQIDTTATGGLDTVTLSTYQNLGSNSSLGLNFHINFSIIKDLTVSLNGQVSHVWLKGSFEGEFYSNDGSIGRAFGSIGYKFASNYRIGLNAGIFSGDVLLQGKTGSYYFSSYVFTRTFLNKNASISLVANNPYSKYFTSKTYTSTPQFYQSSYNENLYRNFAIRFSYKFGKLTSDIKRNQRGINNDDTKGGKTTSGNQ